MGFDLKRQRRDALASMGAVLEGSRNIFWRLTVRENLEYFARLHGLSAKRARPIIERLIETFVLEPHVLKEARMLSKGLQQRLATACAMVKQTPILILDEPTLGLDIESSLNLRTSLRLLVREEGRTVLLTSHEMEMVEAVCERVIILQEGQLLVDSRISDLKQLFRSSSYACVFRSLDGDPTAVDKELRNLPGLRSLERFGEKWRAELEFSDTTKIYEALECLRQANCLIEVINRQEPNLKEAYLRLIDSERMHSDVGC
jgi:ABC-2 type transport system ATP-binding protein